eukprot:9487895-Pyramimonas_sp.AAC.1
MTRTSDALLQEGDGSDGARADMTMTGVQLASAFEMGVELGRAKAAEEAAAARSVRARPDTAHRAHARPPASAAKGATGGWGVADSAEFAKGSVGKGSAEDRLPQGMYADVTHRSRAGGLAPVGRSNRVRIKRNPKLQKVLNMHSAQQARQAATGAPLGALGDLSSGATAEPERRGSGGASSSGWAEDRRGSTFPCDGGAEGPGAGPGPVCEAAEGSERLNPMMVKQAQSLRAMHNPLAAQTVGNPMLAAKDLYSNDGKLTLSPGSPGQWQSPSMEHHVFPDE